MTSFVHESARFGKNVTIMPNTHIGEGCVVGDNSIVQYGSFLEKDVIIGKNTRIGTNVVLRRGTHIGNNSIFGTLSASEGNNWIGNNVTIHSQCHITSGIIIEDKVFIAPFFCGANTRNISHGRENIPLKTEAPHIGFGCRIGIGVLLSPKIKIGQEVLIWPGSIITKDIPDFSIVAGTTSGTIKEGSWHKGYISEDQKISEETYIQYLQSRPSENFFENIRGW
jgi:UDP-2-acetamido-3-amino-2,3-dideoxy-glucuronate N-acetyltransferase